MTPENKSNIKLINGITTIITLFIGQSKIFFIKIDIAVPDVILPNNLNAKDIGSDNSDMIFIGNNIGKGSKNPFKYAFIPRERIPVNWIITNVVNASVAVTIKYPVGLSSKNTAEIFEKKMKIVIVKNHGAYDFQRLPIFVLVSELIKSTIHKNGTSHFGVSFE